MPGQGAAGFLVGLTKRRVRASWVRVVPAQYLRGGKVLAVGGYNPGYLASAELYDPAGTWAATGSMATPRYRFTVTLLQSGKVQPAPGHEDSSHQRTLVREYGRPTIWRRSSNAA